jgi:hypothetical protein
MKLVAARWVAALAIVGSWAPASRAIAPVALETHVVLRVEAITVDGERSKATGAVGTVEAGPTGPVTLDLKVPWGPGGASIAVRLAVTLGPVDEDGGVTLRCACTATAAGRPAVRATRDLRLADEGTGLFEVYGEDDRRLLLTLQGERVERPVVRAAPAPGDPVKFVIAVEGVAGEHSEILQTNEVRSFVGQSVEYGFQLGPTDGRESIRLVLLPVSITGDLITIQVEISGVLPGPEGPAMLSRTDRIVASRGSTSKIAATVGTPPSGYRFQVTPDF